MINNEKKIVDNEKLAIFQQINSWIQHLNHILWTVTSLFGTLNILIIWKFIKGEMTGKNVCVQDFIKYSYPFLIVPQLLFLISIGIITMNLANLLIDNNLTRKKLKDALEIDLLSLTTYKKNWKLFFQSFFRPWGVLLLVYYTIFLVLFFKFNLN